MPRFALAGILFVAGLLPLPADSNQAGPGPGPIKAIVAALVAADPEVRARAARDLGGAEPRQLSALDAGDITILADALEGGEPLVRRAASVAFSRLTHAPRTAALSRPFLGVLAAALKDPEGGVAGSAAIALGHIRDQAAFGPLVDALGDDRHPVVAAAAAALGHLVAGGDAAALVPLVPALRREPARRPLASLFLQNHDRAPVPELAQALSSADVELRVGAAVALENLADRRATAALRAALGDPDARVRATAARGLGRIGDRAVERELIPLLDDRDPDVRLSAAHAMLFLGGRDSVEALIARLKDPSAKVRMQATAALTKIGDGRAVGPLLDLFADNEVGDGLYHTVGHWKGNKELIRGQVEALASPNALVRKRVARSLMVENEKVWVLGREGVAPLLAALKTREVEVRRTAAFSLRTLAVRDFLDQEAVGPLTEAAKDLDPQVRRYAEMALARVGKSR